MLKKNYEFKQVLTRGSFYTGKYIKAVIFKKNININLLGIAVSKKVGKAVVRNKIKRIIRENYKILESNIQTGYVILFLIKNQIDSKSINFNDLNKDMVKVLASAKIMKE